MKVICKVSVEKITVAYLFLYFIFMGIYCGMHKPVPAGEWDDYTLPAVSMIVEHNLSISDNDILSFQKIFPEWAGYDVSLSGFYTRNRGQLAWYFPTYSTACIPMILILRFFGFSACYTFVFTNFLSVMLLLFVVKYCLKANDLCKLALIVLLSINPVMFYFAWPSAETFIYAVLGMAMVFWHNKWYKRAAVFVSLAGTLNPVIMSTGFIMIADYFFNRFKMYQKKEPVSSFLGRNVKDLLCYGLCYVIGLVPMAYNYYHTGHINLTASYPGFTQGRESTLSRFWAYLLDLNFGILPYYCLILLAAFFLLIAAAMKCNWKYLGYISAFMINMLLYSIMIHINCGMSGIARYNAWNSVILLFAVCLCLDSLINIKSVNYVVRGGLVMQAVFLAAIILYYGPTSAGRTSYVSWTPIAEYILDHVPAVYYPLHSTFNSRTTHQDGGYGYETPVVYAAEDGYVRKILAVSSDIDYLRNNCFLDADGTEWFEVQLEKLTERESYISVPLKYHMKYYGR